MKTASSKPASRKPAPPRSRSRGTLVVIAFLLVSSALVRLGSGAGSAFALAPDAGQVDAPDSLPASAPLACEAAPDLKQLLQAFEAREARIEQAEADLRDRMQALAVADREVGNKLAELNEAEARLRETIAIAESAADTDIDRLTQVYESMKPKQAAALFEQMDPNFAAGFLGRMRPEAAAGIMASLAPDVAHMFSVVIAGRNAGAPRE